MTSHSTQDLDRIIRYSQEAVAGYLRETDPRAREIQQTRLRFYMTKEHGILVVTDSFSTTFSENHFLKILLTRLSEPDYRHFVRIKFPTWDDNIRRFRVES